MPAVGTLGNKDAISSSEHSSFSYRAHAFELAEPRLAWLTRRQ
jgi:hypothetical protein